MEKLYYIWISIALIIALYCVWVLLQKAAAFSDALANLSLTVAKLESQFEEQQAKLDRVQGAYDEAKELIEATKEYTREATNSEKMWQDGFSAIVNYDAFTALADQTEGDKK